MLNKLGMSSFLVLLSVITLSIVMNYFISAEMIVSSRESVRKEIMPKLIRLEDNLTSEWEKGSIISKSLNQELNGAKYSAEIIPENINTKEKIIRIIYTNGEYSTNVPSDIQKQDIMIQHDSYLELSRTNLTYDKNLINSIGEIGNDLKITNDSGTPMKFGIAAYKVDPFYTDFYIRDNNATQIYPSVIGDNKKYMIYIEDVAQKTYAIKVVQNSVDTNQEYYERIFYFNNNPTPQVKIYEYNQQYIVEIERIHDRTNLPNKMKVMYSTPRTINVKASRNNSELDEIYSVNQNEFVYEYPTSDQYSTNEKLLKLTLVSDEIPIMVEFVDNEIESVNYLANYKITSKNNEVLLSQSQKKIKNLK